MATVEKRISQDGEEVFRVKIRLKGAAPQTGTFLRKTDAKKWIASTESAIREGRYFKGGEAKRHTVTQMIDRYIAEVLPQKAPKTMLNQKQQLGWWKEQIGHNLLSDITPPVLIQCRDRLGGGKDSKSPSTVIRYMAALSHAFTIAFKEWQWLDDNPLRKVTKPKEPRGRVRFLSDDERKTLLETCDKNPCLYLSTIVILAIYTGARKSEILNLTWDAISFEKKRIILEKTKNGDRRALHLPGPAFELVRELSKVRRLDTNLVFPRKDGLAPIDLKPYWEEAVTKAKLEDFRFHDLRHCFASYLAMSGASLPQIAEAMGHKTFSMVRRYAHLTESHTATVIERMTQNMASGT